MLTGLQAMLDPPRTAATAAVAACHTAGIQVKMITGDHAATAIAIAGQVGLLDGHEAGEGVVLTGTALAALPAEELPEAVDRAGVFARVSPEQKLRLVEALQARGHVVAMTGDGVNDAPALRQANIGVAMGGSGTEVAKDAADMVLTDDDFATIEAAVEEGRGVFDNLTKFIIWTLPTNIGEGLVILAAIMVGAALPILPTQILWINMTTAVALGLMLAFEPKEAGIMTRPPRDPDRPLLTGALMARILLVSTLLVAGSWWLFEWELAHGTSLAEARTAALNLFVVVEAFYLFSCRSLTRSAWRIGTVLQPVDHRRGQRAGDRPARHHLPARHEHRLRHRPDRRGRLAAHPGRRRGGRPRGRPRQATATTARMSITHAHEHHASVQAVHSARLCGGRPTTGTRSGITTAWSAVIYPGYIRSEMNERVSKTPFMVDTEVGVKAMVEAIEQEKAHALVPSWPWVPLGKAMKYLPLPLVRKLV